MTRIYDRKMTAAEACDELHEVSKRGGAIEFADRLSDADDVGRLGCAQCVRTVKSTARNMRTNKEGN